MTSNIRQNHEGGAECRVKVTGMMDGTDLEITKCYGGCGQVTRPVRIEDTRGQVHAIEVTIYDWKVLLMIDAVTKMPLAV
jgi:hypothetical protein